MWNVLISRTGSCFLLLFTATLLFASPLSAGETSSTDPAAKAATPADNAATASGQSSSAATSAGQPAASAEGAAAKSPDTGDAAASSVTETPSAATPAAQPAGRKKKSSVQASPVPQTALPASGVVEKCVDGDTVVLSGGQTIRLIGIDSPELHKKKGQPDFYAAEAKTLLEGMVKGKTVKLTAVGDMKDPHKRLLAVLTLEDGTNVNLRMLEEGAATYYYHKGFPQDFADTMLAAQRTAMQSKRGLWEHILSLPAASAAYIGNRNSRRFSPAESSAAKRISAKNRVELKGLEDAFSQGFAPVRNASFWPAAAK